MRDNFPVARFDLPDDWFPEGHICALIPIPDDPQYLAALIGAIDELRYSASFARDPTKSGASQVARRWREALGSRPIVTVDCDGVVSMFDVRQNPDEPCKLEKSTDNGETWIEFADLRKCPPRIIPGSNGELLVWNPECNGGAGCYVPLLPEPEYDPAFDDPQRELPEDWVLPGNDAGCVYAANVTEAFKSIAERVDYGLQVGTLAQVVYIATSAIYLIGQRILSKKLHQILEQLAALSIYSYAEWNSDYTAFDWNDLTNKLACFFEDNGTVTLDAYITNMRCIEDMSGPVWAMIKAILALVGPNGLNNAADFAGIREAECTPDCDDCGWCHEFDLRASSLGAQIISGEYVPGVGFRSAFPGNSLQVRIDFGAIYQITYMEVDFDADGVTHADGEQARITTQHGTWAGDPFHPMGSFGHEHMVHTGGGTLSEEREPLATGYIEVIFASADAVVTLTRWRVCGTGSDPFAP